MQITKIKVNNFKSLVDFEIDLAKFNCIVGLNGSGKSTFLQFMSFLSQLMLGNMLSWLQQRNWISEDFVPYFDQKKHRLVHFKITFQKENEEGCWEGDFSVDLLRCVWEKLSVGGCSFEVNHTANGCTYVLSGRDYPNVVNFTYQGSIFSQLVDKEVWEKFENVIQFFRSIRAFDLLSPIALKQASYVSFGTIGLWGEHLAHFLSCMDSKTRASIISKIKSVYPAFGSFDVSTNLVGQKTLNISESYHEEHNSYNFQAKEINDGLLRILAMLGQLNTSDPFLLFDEIENGINQELVEFLLKELVEARQQVVVTTHSPLFLNYLDDDLARDSVQYFYKTPEGFTRSRKFFSLPSTSKKLGVLGPGEVIADTNLYKLNEKIEQLDRNEKKEK